MDFSIILKDLTQYPAVSGYEKKISVKIGELFKTNCDIVETDSLYNVVGIKKGFSGSGKKVMIIAHSDEIGFLVKNITENGFVKFSCTGYVDSAILPCQEVVIHGARDIPGGIAAKPAHALNREDYMKRVNIEDLSIDTGMCSNKIAEFVTVGDSISFKAVPGKLQGSAFSSKSLDNRCGIVSMLNIMNSISVVKHDADIYFAATVQKEFNLCGARITIQKYKPDIAIVLDACPGCVSSRHHEEALIPGKGPVIGIGPNLDRKMVKNLICLAREENIPFQYNVFAESTGTETWVTQVSRLGIPTALVALPVRYMHTAVETVNLNDIRYISRLVSRYITKSDIETEEFLCY